MKKLRDLKGLGPKSEKQLQSAGIDSVEALKAMGAVEAYRRLQQHQGTLSSLNFLYALVGALEDRHWQDVARNDKTRLLMELDGYQEFESIADESRLNTE